MAIPVNIVIAKSTGGKLALSSKSVVQGGVGAIQVDETIPADGLCWPLPSNR